MESQYRFKSTVSDLIKYDFLDPPPWRDDKEGFPSAEDMIDQIIDFQKTWSTSKTKMTADQIKDIQEKFREKYCDINTDPLTESEQDKKLQELGNVGKLLEFFDKIVEEEFQLKRDHEEGENQLCCGLIEKSMVQEAHKIAVNGLKIKDGCTQPGVFSSLPRFTTHHSFKGNYDYPEPEDMENEVCLVLDRYNSLITDAAGKTDKRERLKAILKSIAWLLFEVLDLHPFGNGNGRLFRSFCYYVLLSFGQTVVPCHIYQVCNERKNDHSACPKPCKDCYELALIRARKYTKRRPQELATMLVESCWRTWQEFMQEINKCIPEK